MIVQMVKILFRKLFTKRVRSPKDKKILSYLQTRAWFVYIIYTMIRVLYGVTGESEWLAQPETCFKKNKDEHGKSLYIVEEKLDKTCVPYDFNEDFVSSAQPFIKIMCIVLIVFSICLNIAIYKWRGLTKWILYEELVYHLLISIVPTDVKNMTNIAMMLLHFIAFVILYTDTGGHIIAVTIS